MKRMFKKAADRVDQCGKCKRQWDGVGHRCFNLHLSDHRKRGEADRKGGE